MILGVDPGGTYTGWCVVAGDEPEVFDLVSRSDGESITSFARAVARSLDRMGGVMDYLEGVAIEGLVRVTPQVSDRPIDLYPTVEAGIVLGYVWRWAEDRLLRTVWVDPGGLGSLPLMAYPKMLVGPRETKGTGKLRHVRSAYDVARAGRREVRGVRGA